MTTVEVPPERAGIEVDLEGAALLTNPLLNKGTAFRTTSAPLSHCMACCRRMSGPSTINSRDGFRRFANSTAISIAMCFCAGCRWVGEDVRDTGALRPAEEQGAQVVPVVAEFLAALADGRGADER